MPKYAVVSPRWNEYTFRLDDGTGPQESVCEYVEIDAPTAREAKIAAVRLWRKKGYLRYCESDQNPFTGVTALNFDKLEDFDGEPKA